MERVLGMPYGISEWANVLPNQWRLEAPPIMTFYGQCLNGWDVPIHFALDGTPAVLPASSSGCGRSTSPRPSANIPALAQVIRRGDVREGPLVFARNLSEKKDLQRPADEGRGHQGRYLRTL